MNSSTENSITEEGVRELLSAVEAPAGGGDLVSAGWLRSVGISGRGLALELRAPYPVDDIRDEVVSRVRETLLAAPEIDSVQVMLDWRVFSQQVQGDLKPLPGIRNIIAVASGKGGVGKSATAVNLALGLSAAGARTGILDADIYGPSVPKMMGAAGQPDTENGRIIPRRAHGLQLMSIGFLVDEGTAMIWRGPMVTSALQQLLNETAWDDLDYLVVDLPPGTGDIQLTLAQKVPVAGALIVTTPQDIALLDARKALAMFNKVDIPVLGVVENMSTFVCPKCGHSESVFGEGGGAKMAADNDLPLLGQLPLAMQIRQDLDEGQPSVVRSPDSPVAGAYRQCARAAAAALARRPRHLGLGLGSIEVMNTGGGA